MLKLTGFVLLLSFYSFFASAQVTVSSAKLNGVDLKKLSGTYSNKLGFKTKIEVVEKDQQGDLFRSSDLVVEMGGRYEFFLNGDFYLNPNRIRFHKIKDNGDVVFLVDEDCDYNVCSESHGDITLKKKNDGSYYLNIQLRVNFWDYEEGAIKIEELAASGVKDPELEYCKNSYPKIVSSNFYIQSRDMGSCEARVMFFMKKD